MEDNEIAVIEIKFPRSGLLWGVTLKSVYVVSCDAYFKIINKSKPILANDADPATTLLPKFGKIEEDFPIPWFRLFWTKFNAEVFSK